jgi:hypothetical protein
MKDVFKGLKGLIVFGGLAGALLSAYDASGSGIIYDFDNVFSGSAPDGTAPWFQTRIEDVTPGTVRLTITALNLSPTEKVSELYLNLNPNFLATSLNFTFVDGSAGVTAPQPSLGVNAFKADGDGKYDILFQFAEPPVNALTAGDHLTYLISGIAGLTAQDFVYLSMPAGGHGPFYSAIHMQGISATDVNDTSTLSGWVSPSEVTIIPVPEPTVGMLAILIGGVVGGGRWLARRTGRA